MSVGSNLQEMENVVTKGAKAADPMPKLDLDTPGQTASWEDLGGPTPENYKSDDDSAKLKEPSATLKQVKDVVNKGAKPAEAMPAGMKEETEAEEEEVLEDAEEEVLEVEAEGEEVAEEEEEEVAEETEAEFSVEEDVQALFTGEELSEEFQEKARTIFETAIKTKVAEVKEQIEAQYEEALIEEVQSIKSELTERVDAYLEYVADEWIAENALAIEHGLKTEMTESFLAGMKSLFEDHYVSIPEDKYDVIESMVDKLDEMETKLNEQIQRNVALNKRLAESVSDVIFAEVSEGLALSQKDKLASLAENVEFDSEANYREKLVKLRESYFPTNAGTQRSKTESISEEVASEGQAIQESYSPMMNAYLQTLGRAAKK
ncbi:MAG: T4 prohead core scaffold protein [Candidatus Nanopelagicaceae bacterium]